MITVERQRNICGMVAALLLLGNILLSISLSHHDRMIIMVPTIDKEMTVGTGYVSDDYLLYRAEQIIQLVFNIRHENFAYNVEQILKQVSSYKKSEFNKQLDILTADIKSKKYFYTFHKESFSINNAGLTITFSGFLETYVNDKRVATNAKTYSLSFSNQAGLVKLISFEEVKHDKL